MTMTNIPDSPVASWLGQFGGLPQLNDLHHQLRDLCCASPYAQLAPGESNALGGYLFPGAAALVRSVGEALQEDRGARVFPDLSRIESGPALLQGQDVADAWRRHRDLLAEMHARANDSYIKVQGLLVKRALFLIRFVPLSESSPLPEIPPELTLHRSVLLVSAYHLMDRYYQKLTGHRARLQAARKAASGEKAPAPTPRQIQARERAKQDSSDRFGGMVLQVFQRQVQSVAAEVRAASHGAGPRDRERGDRERDRPFRGQRPSGVLGRAFDRACGLPESWSRTLTRPASKSKKRFLDAFFPGAAGDLGSPAPAPVPDAVTPPPPAAPPAASPMASPMASAVASPVASDDVPQKSQKRSPRKDKGKRQKAPSGT